MATAQAAEEVVVAVGCSGAGVAAGSGVVAAGSDAGPPSPRSSLNMCCKISYTTYC